MHQNVQFKQRRYYILVSFYVIFYDTNSLCFWSLFFILHCVVSKTSAKLVQHLCHPPFCHTNIVSILRTLWQQVPHLGSEQNTCIMYPVFVNDGPVVSHLQKRWLLHSAAYFFQECVSIVFFLVGLSEFHIWEWKLSIFLGDLLPNLICRQEWVWGERSCYLWPKWTLRGHIRKLWLCMCWWIQSRQN